jgi:hypothetical protein
VARIPPSDQALLEACLLTTVDGKSEGSSGTKLLERPRWQSEDRYATLAGAQGDGLKDKDCGRGLGRGRGVGE